MKKPQTFSRAPRGCPDAPGAVRSFVRPDVGLGPGAAAQWRWLLPFIAVLIMAVPGGSALLPSLAGAAESCIACHQDPAFRVTNKKLFDYFQLWGQSVHDEEGITCTDCHGGNPAASDKERAHGAKGVGASEQGSPVNYRNIPKTCAQCHEAFYDHYRLSAHFEHLTKKKAEGQGPNCVTCHQSVNTTVLNVNTIRRTCEGCHNEKTGNHPGIPDKAEYLLNKFLSIHRFYRYLTVKGSVLEEDRKIFEQIEERTTNLFIEWHTFDLKEIERKTEGLLAVLKEKRNEIRERLRARRK